MLMFRRWYQPVAAIGGPNYASASKAFFARLATPPTAARKAQYNTMIAALVAAGVWAKLDVFYMFAATDAATALTNLVQSSFGGTAVNSPTFTADAGYTGAATKYIGTSFNPTAAPSPQYTRDSASIGGWSNTSAVVTGSMVGSMTTVGHKRVYSRYTGDLSLTSVNCVATFASVANADGKGFYTGNRSASNATQAYKNGAAVGSDAGASLAVLNEDVILMANTPAVEPFAGQQMCGFIGASMSAGEHLAFYNAVHVYLQAVAGVA